MRFRIATAAILACATAVLVSTGTASASAPAAWGHGGNDIHCPTAGNCTQGGNPYTGSTSACTTYPCTLDANGMLDNDPAHAHIPGGFGGHFYPGPFGGNALGLDPYGLNGLSLVGSGENEILLADGSVVNVCQYPLYDRFIGPFGNRLRGDWRGRLNAFNYPRIVTAACGNVVSVNGLLSNNVLNLGALGVNDVIGADAVPVCSYGTWDAFAGGWQGRLGGHWNHVAGAFGHDPRFAWNGLRTRAHCTNVIVNQQPNVVVVPSAAQTPQALPQDTDPGTSVGGDHHSAPADNPGVGTVQHAPVGAPPTGDGSSITG